MPPAGAASITIATILKKNFVSESPRSTSRCSPRIIASASPDSTASISTCSISPLANAPRNVSGIMFSRKPVDVRCCAPLVYCAIAFVSSVAGFAFTPRPGCTTVATISPSTSANVVTTSKYTSDLIPTRPSRRRSPTFAIPVTTVKKTIGATSIRISFRKPSPNGFIAAPNCGKKYPTAAPATIPTSTRKYSVPRKLFLPPPSLKESLPFQRCDNRLAVIPSQQYASQCKPDQS